MEAVNAVLSKRIKLGVPQINVKDGSGGKGGHVQHVQTTPLVLPPSSPHGRKSTLTPLNAQNVGHRSFGNAGLSDLAYTSQFL